MAYTPTEWATGDVITAEKLNKVEEGLAAASVDELPSVSDVDEGKVLKVDPLGEWAASMPSGVTLYGPYVAYANPGETCQANSISERTYSNYRDMSGEHFYATPNTGEYIGLIIGAISIGTVPSGVNYSLSKGCFGGFDVAPYYTNPTLIINNGTQNTFDASNVAVLFMSTAPFEEYTPD